MDREPLTYAQAGVDVEAGDRAVALMRAAVEATHGPQVLGAIGGGGGRWGGGGGGGRPEHAPWGVPARPPPPIGGWPRPAAGWGQTCWSPRPWAATTPSAS